MGLLPVIGYGGLLGGGGDNRRGWHGLSAPERERQWGDNHQGRQPPQGLYRGAARRGDRERREFRDLANGRLERMGGQADPISRRAIYRPGAFVWLRRQAERDGGSLLLWLGGGDDRERAGGERLGDLYARQREGFRKGRG